jgi:hypothetical protein
MQGRLHYAGGFLHSAVGATKEACCAHAQTPNRCPKVPHLDGAGAEHHVVAQGAPLGHVLPHNPVPHHHWLGAIGRVSEQRVQSSHIARAADTGWNPRTGTHYSGGGAAQGAAHEAIS